MPSAESCPMALPWHCLSLFQLSNQNLEIILGFKQNPFEDQPLYLERNKEITEFPKKIEKVKCKENYTIGP
jgi:hypothetical protein